MRLIFRPTTGREFPLIVGSNNTILQIKEQIEQEIGIPISYQTLRHAGVELPDNFSLAGTIIDGNTILLDVDPQTPQLLLVIRPPTGSVYSVSLPHRSVTVREIKEKIQDERGIPINSQTLFHQNQLLEDHINIIDTTIVDLSVVDLVIAGYPVPPPFQPQGPFPQQLQQKAPPRSLQPPPQQRPLQPPMQQRVPQRPLQQGLDQESLQYLFSPQGCLHEWWFNNPPAVQRPPMSPYQAFDHPPPQLGPSSNSHQEYLLAAAISAARLMSGQMGTTQQQPLLQSTLHQPQSGPLLNSHDHEAYLLRAANSAASLMSRPMGTAQQPRHQFALPRNLQQPSYQSGLPTTSHQEMGFRQQLVHQRRPQAPAAAGIGSGNQRLDQSMPLPTTQMINLTLQIFTQAITLDRDQNPTQTTAQYNAKLEFDKSQTIRQIKTIIEDAGIVSADRLTIFFDNIKLEDNQTLGSYEIPDSSVIEVTVDDLSSPASTSGAASGNKKSRKTT